VVNSLKQRSLPLVALLSALLTTAGTAAAQSSYDLRSLTTASKSESARQRLRYDVLLKGRTLLQDCTLSLDIDHKSLGVDPKVLAARNSLTTRPLSLRYVRSLPEFAKTT